MTLEIQDQQGVSCPDKQVLKVDVCTCDKSATCASSARKGSKLGSAGIGLLFLGLLLLLREHDFKLLSVKLTSYTKHTKVEKIS